MPNHNKIKRRLFDYSVPGCSKSPNKSKKSKMEDSHQDAIASTSRGKKTLKRSINLTKSVGIKNSTITGRRQKSIDDNNDAIPDKLSTGKLLTKIVNNNNKKLKNSKLNKVNPIIQTRSMKAIRAGN